ncbi:MAG TPA: efflux RND transporter periplasmic adaptor subunit [Anaerolineae bacterium]
MKQRFVIIAIVLAVLVLGGGFYLYNTGNLAVFAAANDPTVVSGFIESDQINITSEMSGRIAVLAADEGTSVKAGQPIVQLDPALVNAQIAQAQSAVDAARAQLAQIQDGPRSSDQSAARAVLAAAQQNFDKLRAGGTAADLAAAQGAVTAAQQNYEKVRAGLTADQIAQLKAQLDNARSTVTQAQAAYDRIGGASNPQIAMTPQSAALQQAMNNYNGAVGAYADATKHPTAAELAAAQSQVDQARAVLARLTPDTAQLAMAQSQVEQAQASLDRLTPTADAIAVAQAQVKQAETGLAVLEVQAAKLTIASPADGVIAQRTVHVGEIAAPGAALLTVAQLDPVKLTIYVPEARLGQIKLGDEIGVQVDSFPDRTFKGKVIFIASQAQFTPRNVQTKDQRVNTVFAVKLQIANANGALKPGMPADATLP